MGYTGSRALLAEAVKPWRPPRLSAKQKRLTRRTTVRWICLRPLEQLKAEEREVLEKVLADDVELAKGHNLVQRFRSLVAERDLVKLDGWLKDAMESGLAPFKALANGIQADRAAVEAGISTPWSNGPVEGHIHRVKLLKRQGYGRAKFDLLRRRVLAA